MTRSFARSLLAAAALCAGCRPATGLDDDGTCQQTYEFGNHGCAHVVVMVQGPPEPWPTARRWDVRAVPAREGTGAEVTFSPAPDTGAVPLRLIRRMSPAAGSDDTSSVWVSARMLEDPRPVVPGVPLRTFASDSVLHVARFAPVGSRPPVDTIHLTLQRR